MEALICLLKINLYFLLCHVFGEEEKGMWDAIKFTFSLPGGRVEGFSVGLGKLFL